MQVFTVECVLVKKKPHIFLVSWRNYLSVKFRISLRKRKLPGGISRRNAGEKLAVKAKFIDFMVKHKIS